MGTAAGRIRIFGETMQEEGRIRGSASRLRARVGVAGVPASMRQRSSY
jgi:hypothetical protein